MRFPIFAAVVSLVFWQIPTSVPFHHGADDEPIVSPLNQRYRTPGMEALAAGGMKFTRAYAHPVCTPARVSWITGKNAARHHVTTWTSPVGAETGDNDVAHLRSPREWRKTGIDENEVPLPKLLAAAGYRTIHAGKAHFASKDTFGQNPKDLGFDVNIAGSEIGHPGSYFGKANFGSGSHHVPGLDAYHGEDIFLTEALTREMNRAIESAVAEGVPFFAYMSHYALHSPFQADPRFAGNYPHLKGPALAYATLIEGMDKSLQDIIAKLDELGVANETLILFLSDNGGDAPFPQGNAPLRGKKGTRYEGGIREPMIVGWAKRDPSNPLQAALPISAGSREDDIVHIADVFPTLLAVAGVPAGQPVDGADLTPYLKGQPGTHRPQSLITHFPHGHNDDHFSIYHDGDWKLIFNYADESYELYHLAEDIGETKNLAATEPDRVATMAAAMIRELESLDAQYPYNLRTKAPQPPRLPAVADE